MNNNIACIEPVPAGLVAAMGACAADFRGNAARLVEMVERPRAAVVFGGHFSSGKSTVLNTVVARPMLPTDDLPETSAPCCLSAGDVDEGRIIGEDGRESPVACEAAAIARVASVYGREGGRMAVFPRRLEFRLADAPIPRNTAWVDSPGINDAPAMTAKAMATALTGDALVWVLHSRQCLAAPEILFLSEIVRRRGPVSIAFVVNAFLGEDTEQAWHDFLAREWPRIATRIVDHLPAMGWGDDRPPIMVLSARAVQAHGGRGFGLESLRGFLDAVTGPRCPAVVESRLSRIGLAVGSAIAALEPPLRDAAAALAAAEAALERHRQRLASRGAVLSRIRDLVDEAVEAFGRHAAQVATDVSGQVGERLLRDDTYEQTLNAALRRAATDDFLCRVIDQALAQHGWPALSPAGRAALRERGRAPAVPVTVVDTPLDKGAVAAAAATGGAGGALLGPFALIGALGGAFVGLGAARDDKARRDAAITRGNLVEAAARAARRLSAQLADVAGLVEAHVGEPAPPPPPDPAVLNRLEALRRGYLALGQHMQALLAAP